METKQQLEMMLIHPSSFTPIRNNTEIEEETFPDTFAIEKPILNVLFRSTFGGESLLVFIFGSNMQLSWRLVFLK